MKNAVRKIIEALDYIDEDYEKKIAALENRIAMLEKERSLIVKNIKEGRIELVKNYLFIE